MNPDSDLTDLLWFEPPPVGFERGPWMEACEEVALLCGDPVIPYHNEDLKRLLKRIVRPPGRTRSRTGKTGNVES